MPDSSSDDSSDASRTFLGVRKLPARYAVVVMPFFLSVLMTCVVSLISTWRGVGLVEGFPRLWLGSWAISWAVAFPVLMMVLPLVRKATALVVDVTG